MIKGKPGKDSEDQEKLKGKVELEISYEGEKIVFTKQR